MNAGSGFPALVHIITETNHVICWNKISALSPGDWNEVRRNSPEPLALVFESKGKVELSIGCRHRAIIPVVSPEATVPLEHVAGFGGDRQRHVYAQAVSGVVFAGPFVVPELRNFCQNRCLFFRRRRLCARLKFLWDRREVRCTGLVVAACGRRQNENGGQRFPNKVTTGHGVCSEALSGMRKPASPTMIVRVGGGMNPSHCRSEESSTWFAAARR